MSKQDVQKDISDLIVNALSRDFWLSVQDELTTAYFAADSLTTGDMAKLGRPEQVRFRPRARLMLLSAAPR